jgi:hypothetical protein
MKRLIVQLHLRTFENADLPEGVVGVLAVYESVKAARLAGCKREELRIWKTGRKNGK